MGLQQQEVPTHRSTHRAANPGHEIGTPLSNRTPQGPEHPPRPADSPSAATATTSGCQVPFSALPMCHLV